MLGTKPSKTDTARTIRRLIHNHHLNETQLHAQLLTLYADHATQPPNIPPRHYHGKENPDLDAPFTLTELTFAISNLTRNTTPGKDRIHNKLLRNLSPECTAALLDYFNHCWTTNYLPPQWKHAEITLIPKPGKPVTLENLRPISLTSCVGKLYEHLVNNRLTAYLEDNNLLPHTMFGFRPHLSSQDVLLQLKEEVLAPLSSQTKRAILALDIKGAFDNVSHQAILDGLQFINCGTHIYNYIQNFLTDRTATLNLGPVRSISFRARPRGTPQGSVISPLLFNLSLLQLPPLLQQIPHIQHALYADDLTIWTTGGSIGQQQDSLQEAINTTDSYLRVRGLSCAPEKSALLVLQKRTQGRKRQPLPDPELSLHDTPILTTPTIRVLGLTIQSDGAGISTIHHLQGTLLQITHLIKRIANRRQGLKENDLVRLIQALLISRITYGTPYLALKNSEIKKLDIIIRQAYKLALGLPPTTSTAKFLQMGIHNTWDELREAHHINQIERLKLTHTGCHLLRRLGYQLPATHNPRQRIPLELRNCISVAPIPKNMHPVHNQGRRQARVRMLRKILKVKPQGIRYVDAAKYHSKLAFAITTTDYQGTELTSATVFGQDSTTAEEIAIALAATTSQDIITVVTDSQAACRRYAAGYIDPLALRILQSIRNPPDLYILWTPGHESLEGNEAAHAAARAHIYRAFPSNTPASPSEEYHSVPRRYKDILEHYRLERRTLPPPHEKLTKEEANTYRRLQTNTYPHGTLLHAIHPTSYSATCKYCPQPCTLYHMIWACANTPSLPPIPSPNHEQWEGMLASPDPGDQLRLVERARQAATAQGLLD